MTRSRRRRTRTRTRRTTKTVSSGGRPPVKCAVVLVADATAATLQCSASVVVISSGTSHRPTSHASSMTPTKDWEADQNQKKRCTKSGSRASRLRTSKKISQCCRQTHGCANEAAICNTRPIGEGETGSQRQRSAWCGGPSGGGRGHEAGGRQWRLASATTARVKKCKQCNRQTHGRAGEAASGVSRPTREAKAELQKHTIRIWCLVHACSP